MTRPTGSSKYCTTRKNIQRYYTPKRLMQISDIFTRLARYLYSMKQSWIINSDIYPLTLTVPQSSQFFSRKTIPFSEQIGWFHYPKDSGNFGRNSNGKGLSRFHPTGILGVTSGMVHFFRSEYSDLRSIFDKPVFFGKGIKNGKCHSYWLAQINRKMTFHFPRLFPLISDRSVWHNGKPP